MPINNDTKSEIIAKINELDNTKKLKCMALYENLLKSYQNEDDFSEKTRDLYYYNNVKVLELVKDLNLILEGNEEIISKYNNNKAEYFTNEELESEEFKKPLENIKENFYYNSIKKCNFLSEFIEPYDEPILKNLEEIYSYNSKENDNIRVEFIFKKNDYFTNKKLNVEMISSSLNSNEVIEVKSDIINWKPNKDPRYKIDKSKKKKNKQLRESFFNYFCNIKEEDLEDEEDEEYSKDLLSDSAIFSDSVEIMNCVIKEIINYSIPCSYFNLKVPAFEENLDLNSPIKEEEEESEKNKEVDKKPECNNQ